MGTTFFAYDELTWPEVRALPRDTPLALPFGNGYAGDAYALEQVSKALGAPAQVGLLPALPFGWSGSGLAVPTPVLGHLVRNLMDSLREDGFERVFAVAPPGDDLGLGDACLALHPQPGQVEALPGEAGRGKVILLPAGHTEQHGLHLPLSTDTLIIDAIARGTAQQIPAEAASLPVFPYGVSTHRASFAGTLNAGGRAFEDFWLAVIDALVLQGFDRFYLLSGHGGNCSFFTNTVKYAGERHRRIFCATAWLYLSGPQGASALQERRRSPLGGMGHACELETALLLYLRPELVHMARVVDETDFITTPSYYMDWLEGGALVANPPWDDDTRTGAYGAGSLATAENGRFWLQAAIDEKAAQVSEIHEQHRRREARRAGGYGLWGRGDQQSSR